MADNTPSRSSKNASICRAEGKHLQSRSINTAEKESDEPGSPKGEGVRHGSTNASGHHRNNEHSKSSAYRYRCLRGSRKQPLVNLEIHSQKMRAKESDATHVRE